MNSGRLEPRIAIEGWARLEPRSAEGAAETAAVENISRGGARLRAARRWESMESVFMTWLGHSGPLEARVVYQEATGDGRHAIGVRFEDPLPDSTGMLSAPRRGR